MLPTIIRIVTAATLYACVALAVLVSGLALWTEFHHSLRSFGYPSVITSLVFILIGAPAFLTATLLGQRLVTNRISRVSAHLGTAGVLYVGVIVGMVEVITTRIARELEGADIALRALLLVMVYGICINALTIWRVRRTA